MTALTKKEYQKYFNLKPIKAAKVSEISEKTASSNIPAEDKLNFHIGNPVLDSQLVEYFLHSLYQIDNKEDESDFIDSLKSMELEESDIELAKFIKDVVEKSSPYMPRGGYSSKTPNKLIKQFEEILTKKQQEPLKYSIGENGDKRECTIASGGLFESLRIIFYSLVKYLNQNKINILTVDLDIPNHLLGMNKINCQKIDGSGNEFIEYLENILLNNNSGPYFLFLGKILDEGERRQIRRLVLNYPLMIIEANDAPNNLSIAREARLEDRVIRVLTPGFINSKFSFLPVNLICGNQDFIKVFETVHFQLLGTPSSSEINFLSYLIDTGVTEEKNVLDQPEQDLGFRINEKLDFEIKELPDKAKEIVSNQFDRYSQKLNSINNVLEKHLDNFDSSVSKHFQLGSKLKTVYTPTLVNHFLSLDNDVLEDLEKDFLTEFCSHHPEYKRESSFAISGSARTALGLVGFHCGIEEVVIPDLSWTYEHCFPKVNVVPLKDGLKLDDVELIKFVENRISNEPEWKSKSAVVINNPHNASGKVFPEIKLINVIKFCLNNNIYLIDDLSYQNVAPNNGKLDVAKTLRQITLELIRKGYVAAEKEKYLISVHSLSKTDCFAGARLSVINIPDKIIQARFNKIKSYIVPNYTALLIAYLFYRNDSEIVSGYWKLRNKIFMDRMEGIERACFSFPKERNFFDIEIIPPTGSMYPQLIINKLPGGLSLDWLASGLASQGIGMVPLSTFARTAKGFEIARKMFRLTLGGSDNGKALERKTRRLLIDLNRLISEEVAKYNVNSFLVKEGKLTGDFEKNKINEFSKIINILKSVSLEKIKNASQNLSAELKPKELYDDYKNKYFLERIEVFENRLKDHLNNLLLINQQIKNNEKKRIISNLKNELYKDDLENRAKTFKKRLFDRTVHPTQVYSLKVDICFNKIIDNVLKDIATSEKTIQSLAEILVEEYLGANVAIKSVEEADELIADLETFILSEEYLSLVSDEKLNSLLSFWGDWDGSNRPSGQGHRLVAAAVVENVNRLSSLLIDLKDVNPNINVDAKLFSEILDLKEDNRKFWELLNKITQLTNQLEKRYQSLLPYEVQSNRFKRVGIQLGIVKDPITSLWQHNDRVEKKMFALRLERKRKLEKYFELNKKLRKTLYFLLPEIEANLNNPKIFIASARYKNILNRFVLTPRIHQKLITSKDQFSIDTTVYNIIEINEISGQYGNPGMIMALQVSMSSKANALIALDRKLRTQREEVLRSNPKAIIPTVWVIPLFEDIESVNGVGNYLDKLWEYAKQVREINQDPKERFLEMVCEIFIAGSDLSQQISQTASADLYNTVKFNVTKWMADKGITQEVRMKLGSGEPMQRQGGYYNKYSGKPAFLGDNNSNKILKQNLSEAVFKSTDYATTPLLGVASRGDLRTFQSNISEHLRNLKNTERTQLLYHVQKAQRTHRDDLIRASEPMTDTRFRFEEKGIIELERLTIGNKDNVFDKFVELAKTNFQSILYGSDEDVVGIHLISYFISRTTPTLRDRPTVRPSKDTGSNRGQQIIEKIAKTIPMNRQGSALRAIGHNRAQTVILGVNQLTTGLFRALIELNNQYSHSGNISPVIEDSILPKLPVYEILTTLRYYQDIGLNVINKMHKAFPAGNSSFMKLREDMDGMFIFIGLMQKELLRRHGLNTTEFFVDNKFNEKLLPCLRADLAMLMQNDLFNTDINVFTKNSKIKYDPKWLADIKELISIPDEVKKWRNEIWKLLERPILQQVKSFVELALALNTLSNGLAGKEIKISGDSSSVLKLDQNIVDLLKGSVDDSMRQFLQAAVHYLTSLPESRKEIPIDIVRAIKDVERILKIEEQALSQKDQKLFNFYVLQIARLCGENG